MTTLSSTLAWKIPWTEEPGRLQFMGSRRVGRNWATSLSLLTFMHWRRQWQPTPVFLPGESQRRGSLVGCHLWGCTETDHDWSNLAAAAVCFMVPFVFFYALLHCFEYYHFLVGFEIRRYKSSSFVLLFSGLFWLFRNIVYLSFTP